MQQLLRNSITPMKSSDCQSTLFGRLKSFYRRADEWSVKHRKQFIILIVCMIAYATVLMILSSGYFARSTIVVTIQCLNALSFFLAVAALLKKSNL